MSPPRRHSPQKAAVVHPTTHNSPNSIRRIVQPSQEIKHENSSLYSFSPSDLEKYGITNHKSEKSPNRSPKKMSGPHTTKKINDPTSPIKELKVDPIDLSSIVSPTKYKSVSHEPLDSVKNAFKNHLQDESLMDDKNEFIRNESENITPVPIIHHPDQPIQSNLNTYFPPSPTKKKSISPNHHSINSYPIMGEELLLKTGEDAIDFFARYGSTKSIKFIHLQRADTGIRFSPYTLIVVHPNKIHNDNNNILEYFTMSAAGLVHVCPNEPSEFIPLSEWIRQSSHFNVLTSIHFFKNYLIYKCYQQWQKNIRFRLFCRQRKKINEILFLAKDSFCNSLLQIKRYMIEIQNIVVLDVKTQKTYESSAFIEYQSLRRTEATKQFENILEKVQSIVQKSCADVINLSRNHDHLYTTNNNNNTINQTNDLNHSNTFNISNEKTKSIVAIKQEQLDKKKMQKRAVQEANMLSNFIRLVDYITYETFVALAIQSCHNFLQELLRIPRKTGLFETTIQFSENGETIFSPTCEQIQSMVLSVIDSMVNTVNSISRILYIRPFTQYLGNNVITDSPHIALTIRSSQEYSKIGNDINHKISIDYMEAAEYVKIFDSVRPIFEYDRNWDFDEYSQRPHTVTSLKNDMLKINTWEKELEKMRVGQTIGILHVESRKLKQNLIPMITAKIESIKGLVKDLVRVKCKNQLLDYKQRIQILVQRPQHLKEFANHVEKIQGLKSKQKALIKNTNVVDEMYRLLSSYGVRINSEDMVQLDDLRSVQESYREETESVETFIQDRMTEMNTQLNGNITRLDEQIIQLHNQIQIGIFIDSSYFDDPTMIHSEIELTRQKIQHLDEMAKQYTEYQNLFGTDTYKYENLIQIKEFFHTMEQLWTAIQLWNEKYNNTMSKSFSTLDIEELSEEVNNLSKDAFMYHKKLNNDVTSTFKDRTTDFKNMMPCILELGNIAIKDRHWEKIFRILRQPWYPGTSFSLENLLHFNILDYKDQITEISGTASGEAQIENSLELIKKSWDHIKFNVISHRDRKDAYILTGLDDILTQLEDNQVTLQTMMGSRYILGVKEEVELWDSKLSLLSETLDEWITCQRNWVYLETIFNAEDIQKQLPSESQKFQMVDKNWKSTMLKTLKEPNVMKTIEHGNEMLEQFKISNKLLEEIQKSLEDYLETKRMAFPRFYFLSNDELLEILSQTRDPRAVQPHLGKCFDAMKSIQFENHSNTNTNTNHIIKAMISGEGEVVSFPNTVAAIGPVEAWLVEVEKAMKHSLYYETVQSIQGYPKTLEKTIDRKEWIFSSPAQVIILVDQIFWTKNLTNSILEVEKSINKNAISSFLNFSIQQIDGMVRLVRGELSKLQRILLGALITIDVHARDVVRSLVENNVSLISDFEWTRQLRYYWDEEINNCVARQTNTRFVYAFEYLGNSPRLVITPLTDICYMTLTGALHLRLGGAPAGPAGTGKTETTKDLAKALAIQCVVFNCSDGLDYKIMGRFFSGLAQAGAWACFDEFNRIDIEVLSVIAQQILCIQQAIISNMEQFEFEGNRIRLNTGFGVFITMNPGYAGRTELPDNLKALFRPVSMMVPDYRLIAEIVLFSEGFANALPLSNKMVQLYSLSSEQLSKQDHYDFGMRAVKSVLVAAGQLKRKEPETNEDLLVIRAMRDSNIPKFLEMDLPLFKGIIDDLFPNIHVPFVDYGNLQESIEKQLDLHHLQKTPSFITKAIQVHETQLVRHGLMLVGETGSGKSTVTMILAKALTQLYEDKIKDRDGFYQNINRLILNPKSITAGQLYGEFNLLTNEWSDGLIPKLVRQCVIDSNENSNRKWIIFDGPVDAVWIENMNTVLDDNKTLCLSNSERIKLPSTLHMMFEVQDLKVASPATVSRCGMVYMEQIHVGIMSLARTWRLLKLTDNLVTYKAAEKLLKLIETYVPNAINYVRNNCKEKIPSNNSNLMQSCLNLVYSCIQSENISKNTIENNNKTMILDDSDGLIEMYFLFSMTWSIGANIDYDTRIKFNIYILEQFSWLFDKIGKIDNIYNYTIDKINKNWISWNNLTDNFIYNANAPYFSMFVPTQDTTKYRFLLDCLIHSNLNILYSGETGVGKSIIIQSYLNEISQLENNNEFISYTIGYSAQTKPSHLKEIIELKLDKKRKNQLGPPNGKKMVFFIDDLNMPSLEIYGAQPINELLRQLIDQNGFYDTNKLFFKYIKDVLFISACSPPGGGRSEVSPRLLRHFHMIWIPNLSETSMNKIFTCILNGFLSKEIPELSNMSTSIVQASVLLYQKVQLEMLPTPLKSHYTFNLRDLSKVFQGILMIQKENVILNVATATSTTTTTSNNNSNNDSTNEVKDILLRLWLHEVSRVFRDRLIDDNDRNWFNTTCSNLIYDKLLTKIDICDFKDILFGDYHNRDQDYNNKKYTEIKNIKNIQILLNEYLEEYNLSLPSQMDLVFFNDAIHHISRICRILRQPRGNALLVGVGGSGRKSLTRLATFISNYKYFSIEITRGYGINEFHEDLKKILFITGAENQKLTFLFSDTQIINETFLQDINNILNSGEVPNLFALDEMEKIIYTVRPLTIASGKVNCTREEIYLHFINLVRDNLHIVLTFSPIGSSFRNRCRMFPSLVNCCTINWFNSWPEDALYSVAFRFIHLPEMKEYGIMHDTIDKLCKIAVYIHKNVEISCDDYYQELGRKTYTTPTSYLELLRLYIDMLRNQREIVKNKENKYRIGLKKLAETEDIVAKLQIELTNLQPILQQAQLDTSKLLIQVEKDQQEADKQQIFVQSDVETANKIAEEVKYIKDDCQKDLDEAMPAYYASIKALGSLKKDDITVLKTFTNPPRLVGVTLNAVCCLFGVKQDWNEAKKLLNDMKFLDKLKEYDKDNIPSKTIKQLSKFMTDDEFTPETLSSISTAATSLCMWVRAMYTYDSVAKNIAPKKEKLQIAELQLEKEMNELAKKQSNLDMILKKVEDLNKTLEITQKKSIELQNQTETTQSQLIRAKKLIDSLGEEKIRWNECANILLNDMQNLLGDMIISAGCIAYLGPFNAYYRNKLKNQWIVACQNANTKLPVDTNFSLQRILCDPSTIREWNILGLPADDFSSENGIFVKEGRRWPLMIDPQGQANKWIKNINKSLKLQIIKLTDKDFLRTLENGIRYGGPILLENVQNELDPSLEPVLLKQIFKRGGQNLLHLGDSDIPYNDNFRFYITTKLSNPHYLPEICIKVTIINFTVTLDGLIEQLLVDVIKNERYDLEQKKDELTVAISYDKKMLKEIEDKILFMLENSKGNILDDEELINVLSHSKTTSITVKKRMKEAENTSKEINETREGYRCIALRGSIIYFVISNLSLIDPMYQYSLQFYQKLFINCLENSDKSDDKSKRINILLTYITRFMYLNICRGLFEKDKLIYSFMICSNILMKDNLISLDEWKFYCIGFNNNNSNNNTNLNKIRPSWIDIYIWESLIYFSKLNTNLNTILESFKDSNHLSKNEWKNKMILSDNPHKEILPEPWEDRLSNFQKLLLLKIFRPEILLFGTKYFVEKELGSFFIESPSFDLNGCYDDSNNKIPLIFVLSPGADITDYLLELGKNRGKTGNSLKIISLGQGQGPIAEIIMSQARISGDWVCLQNCHLAVSWLGKLEQILEKSENMETHSEFRLWLTSMPSLKFPVPILQNGIKITNEPPKGIKANLGRTFDDIKDEVYQACNSFREMEYKKFLFALAFYNAICLERRKFGAVGWNIPYEWMNSDLKTGIQQVKLYLEETKDGEIPYKTLNVMVADITYGGRITDRWDKRTNSSIMERFFCPDILNNSNYKFSLLYNEYYIPENNQSLQNIREYIQSLPITDYPDLFGLHSNADITFQQKETKRLLDTIVQTSGTGKSGSSSTNSLNNDMIILNIIYSVQDRLPDYFDETEGHPESFKDPTGNGTMNSLGVFLSQEMIRFNGLIKVIKSSLILLKKAIKGLVVMSSDLENMYNGFLLQQIPKEWENAGYPCLKPLGSWIEDFFLRIHFMRNWLIHGPPITFWISGFFFPQGFMTAVKQTYSRENHVAIDTLRIDCEILSKDEKEISKKPKFGTYIYGLFLEGARFNRDTLMLAESLPGILFDQMPVIWLKPVNNTTLKSSIIYECPLYKTSIRAGTLSTTGHSTNFVVSLDIQTDKDPNHWIRRGCAMLCMLDT